MRDLHLNALTRLHGLPCRVMRWKFAACNNHLITGRPLKRVGDSRETSSRSARQRDVILARPNQGRQGLAQTPSDGKKDWSSTMCGRLFAATDAWTALSATRGIAACAAKFKYVASSIGNHSSFQSIDCIVIICSQATCPACPISSSRRGRRVHKRARDPTTKYSTPITGYRRLQCQLLIAQGSTPRRSH